jgi:hypothetical protein
VRPGILLKQSFSCHHALSPEGSHLLLLRHPPPFFMPRPAQYKVWPWCGCGGHRHHA